ncbi:nitronate monooxygenase [Nocardioides alcanivorans]|uniref:nitronate monooxygenase n=1 Tax=Nocardioides alcanivorans TaxID=2897352 RepID=UPI001F22B6E3|nr:tRNA-dihydrouridine synthase [Nocardioides alcanivorans]
MNPLAFTSPVVVASGCGGTGRDLAPFDGLAGIGAFITRSLTLNARTGWPAPRVSASDSGIVHATGLPNPGPEQFLALELPRLVADGIAPIASLAAGTAAEWAELAHLLSHAPGLRGLELNLAADAGLLTDTSPQHLQQVVAAVRARVPTGLPVIAKLGFDTDGLVASARAVVDGGADAVTVGGGLPALMPDGRLGSLVGPAIQPVALRAVASVHTALPDVPVLGAGGIRSAAGARAFLSAGASAVQIGSALLADPTAAAHIAADLEGDR